MSATIARARPANDPPARRDPDRLRPRQVLVLIATYGMHGRQILRGIIDASRRLGPWEFHFVYGRGIENTDWVSVPDGLDGLIAAPSVVPDIQKFDRFAVPTVLAGPTTQETPHPVVMTDEQTIARMAVDELTGRGFKQLGFCGPRSDRYPLGDRRVENFVAEAGRRGIEPHVFPKVEKSLEWNAEKLHPLLVDWVKSLPKPIGLFTGDERGRNIAHACRAAGILVPEHVAILGLGDDDLLCELAFPPLSSIDHGAYHVGVESARLLDPMMDGKPAPSEPTIVQPVGVITRQSTDTLAISVPEVRQAVRFIRENACDGATVADVLRAVPVARRTLEVQFRKVLDRTVHQEITRVRVERSKLLLASTHMDMPEIAAACGFSHRTRFSAVFKRLTGMSPRDHRSQYRGA